MGTHSVAGGCFYTYVARLALSCLLAAEAVAPRACYSQRPKLVAGDRDPVTLPAANSLVLGAMEDRLKAGRNEPLSQVFSVETEPFEEFTLQTFDALWSRRLGLLERGEIDQDDFEVIVPPWRDVPKAVPFQLLNSDQGSSGSSTKILPGDFVLVRSTTGIRVLVVAGRGQFGLGVNESKSHTFFYYPLMWSRSKPKDGCRTLQLNTFPPRLTLEIATVIRKASQRSKNALPKSAFVNHWLKPNTETSKSLPLLGGCYLRLRPWRKEASGLQYCVVRLRPLIFCSGSKGMTVERDLRYAINAAQEGGIFLRQHPDATRNFREAFGVSNPTQMHYDTVAGVYEDFVGHMVKAIILETAVSRDAGTHDPPAAFVPSAAVKKSARLAFVKGNQRCVIYLEPAYFKLPASRRSATLIHEFCHAWGMARHPGTGDYGSPKQAAVVRQWLMANGQPPISALSEPHRMVRLTERGMVKALGFLPWEEHTTEDGKPRVIALARRNAYCFGFFIYWNHGNFWSR